MIGTAGLTLARPGRAANAARAVVETLAVLVAGAVAATALPPWHVLPSLLGFAVLVAVLRRGHGVGRAFRLGWAFGLGWFLIGLYWVAIAFYTDAERFGALAVPAVILLAMICAVFPGAAAALVAACRLRSLAGTVLVFAAAWTLGEQLRGGWGIQFPWNPVAIAWSADDTMLQLTAWLGSPSLSLLTVLVACLPASLAEGKGRRRRAGPVLAALMIAVGYGGGSIRLATTPPPPDTGLTVRLVQAAVPQHLKWDTARRPEWLKRHLELSARPSAAPLALIVWPESAVPFQIERETVVRDLLGEAAPRGGHLVTGGDRVDFAANPMVASNSVFVIGPAGEIVTRYDKVDLVPFGEFLPARPLLAAIGLRRLVQGSFDFAAGPGRVSVALPGVPPFSPLICYEAIFPGRAMPVEGTRSAWLLNVTNDAWFGDSAGPYQHLAMARTRAVEEGVPLVRAANSGISVVTDAFGRIRAHLPLGSMGVLDTTLPGALAEAPPYARHATALTLGGLLLAAAAGIGIDRALRQRP